MACTKAEKTKYRLLDNMKAALNGAVLLLRKNKLKIIENSLK
jgi:hypothetical protein